MSAIDTARAVYEEETQGEQNVNQLASALERRADALEQEALAGEQAEMREDTRREISDVLSQASAEEKEEAAEKLDEAAGDLRSSLGAHNPTMKDLPGNAAGQAQLDSSNMWVDPDAIQQQGTDTLIDENVAKDIGKHEARHQQQSALSDAEQITVKRKTLNATELREFDAMEAQDSHDFLSADYKATRAKVASVLSGVDRELIKKGQFRQLEKQYAGEQALAA